MNKLVKLFGELNWVRVGEPEIGYKATPNEPDKYQWKANLSLTKESLMEFMDLQATYGLKNKLSKKEDGTGYAVNFNRPTERVNKKTGKVVKKYTNPTVTVDGKPFDGMIGNGSEGYVVLEMEEFKLMGDRKGYAARLHSIEVTKLIPYGSENTEQKGFDQ